MTAKRLSSHRLALATVLGFTWTLHAACPRYEVAAYIEVPGCWAVGMSPTAINAHGHACGAFSCNLGYNHAWVWYGDELIVIPMPDGEMESYANDLNDDGVVVGWVEINDSEHSMHAFRYSAGTTELLPALKEGTRAQAASINSDGVIVGRSFEGDWSTPNHAVRWTNGEVEDLAGAPGVSAYGYLINDNGTVVMRVGDDPIWLVDDERYEIPLLPGTTTWRLEALAETELIVGSIHQNYGVPQPAVWSHEAVRILNGPSGRTSCGCGGTNPEGTILVGSCNSPDIGVDVIWIEDVPFDLRLLLASPSPTFHLTEARDVNGAGQILAAGGFLDEGLAMALILERVPPVPGDATCEGVVDFRDILAVLGSWGECGACNSDLDGSGRVDLDDLHSVLMNWQR